MEIKRPNSNENLDMALRRMGGGDEEFIAANNRTAADAICTKVFGKLRNQNPKEGPQ
jgi:hypothetical protein